MRWLRGKDSNLRPSGYEPDELPLLHPATFNATGAQHERQTTRKLGLGRISSYEALTNAALLRDRVVGRSAHATAGRSEQAHDGGYRWLPRRFPNGGWSWPAEPWCFSQPSDSEPSTPAHLRTQPGVGPALTPPRCSRPIRRVRSRTQTPRPCDPVGLAARSSTVS